MTKDVKCVVEECEFNQNNLCNAEDIEVRSSGDLSVKSSDGTACETFKPQGK